MWNVANEITITYRMRHVMTVLAAFTSFAKPTDHHYIIAEKDAIPRKGRSLKEILVMKRSLPLDRIPSPPNQLGVRPIWAVTVSWQLLSQSVKLWSYGPYQTVMHFLDRHITGHSFHLGVENRNSPPHLTALVTAAGDAAAASVCAW